MLEAPLRIDPEYDLYINGERIGTITNIQQYWPAFQGDFVGTEAYQRYRDVLSRAANSTESSNSRASALNEIYERGLELRSRHSTQILTRTVNSVRFGEIAYIYVVEGKAWFRLFHDTLDAALLEELKKAKGGKC